MVRYYTTIEVYGERSDLPKIEAFCKEHDLVFEHNERFDTPTYADYKKSAETELGFNDAFKCWISTTKATSYDQIFTILNKLDGIDIYVKIDM